MIAKGTTLRQFAERKGLPASSVYAAASGARSGVKAHRILADLDQFLAN